MPPSSLLPPVDLQPVRKVMGCPAVSDVTSSEFAPTMAGMVRESDDTMTPPSDSSAASGVRSAMSFEVPLYTMPRQDWVPSAQAQLVQQQQVSLSSESFLMSMCWPNAGLMQACETAITVCHQTLQMLVRTVHEGQSLGTLSSESTAADYTTVWCGHWAPAGGSHHHLFPA